MRTDDLARHLLDRAASDEQVAHRIRAGDDVPRLRAEIRRLARERGIRIRTSILGDVLGDVLVVVRADAAIWNDDIPTMRVKLLPVDETGGLTRRE
ncbi:hypothetical protein B7R54_11350 [Subtercola boreus]|uniref:Uncharacterized protein n=1 Tax=Subtercola boreus TaxID=120213 RepID=A0A3E0VJC6_9MICO|nr:hypothetical protein [Subtercola boreus]RFA09735.1 hypothetical protein B7R54_11350 [Subtercola boreus]TQL53159.1 hypothetical protein FB464_0652 [Subtercola boreus]